MPSLAIMVALVTGSIAILLGLWPGLDRLMDELRSMTALGMLQPAVPTRRRDTVTRRERLCFIGFGTAVILFSAWAAFAD